jgi:hypothetical protein
MQRLLFGFYVLTSICNILPGIEKSFIVSVPNMNFYDSSDDVNVIYRINTNEDGIIDSIVSLNNKEYNPPKIIISDKRITITSDVRRYAIEEIIITGNKILVRGGPKSIYTRDDSGFLDIVIDPMLNIIYENDEVKLVKTSEYSVEELYKIEYSRYMSNIYSDNILRVDYRFRGNTIEVLEYKKDGNDISITYQYMDDKYKPDIKISGDSLYSPNNLRNALNYFILLSTNNLLAKILFPTIFLQNPFGE